MKRILLTTAVAVIGLLTVQVAFAGDTDNATDKKAETTSNEAINWKALGKFVPETLDGYTAGDLDGGTISMPDPGGSGKQFSHSTVQRTFTRETDDGQTSAISVAIMDTGMAKMLLQSYLMQSQMEYDGPEGSMKSIELDGRPATQVIEYGDSAIDQAVVFTILKDRVVVAVTGEGMEDSAPVLKVAKSIDYDGLEKLIK